MTSKFSLLFNLPVHEYASETINPPTPMNTSEAFLHFFQHCRAERQVASSTLAKYQDCFQAWLLPRFGQFEPSFIHRIQVLDLREAMMLRKLSPARQYSVIICLKSFLKFCRTTLALPCLDPAEISLPKRGRPNVEYLTNEEIGRMFDAINVATFTGIRLRALCELLLSTGCRISEALALKRDIFDANQNEVQIIGKGKRSRHIFFSQRCRFWVREYLAKRIDDDPALFVTTGYPVRRLKREDISRFFINLKKTAKIDKHLTPHLLRHTFCTNLLFNGADITHIKDLAGHQDIQTTARYYLGKDKSVLKRVVEQCLDYRVAEQPAPPYPLLTDKSNYPSHLQPNT
ncbi:MAG TPA: tyrosine-type recombinase/integrase [Bryobacteraceae bacterium]|nr:tyrosine-type recombinase/integrase [Bryobacteraceae bacterium]